MSPRRPSSRGLARSAKVILLFARVAEVLLYSVKSVRPRTPVPDAATSTMVNRSGEAAGTPTAVR